jgi:hypothetical protein
VNKNPSQWNNLVFYLGIFLEEEAVVHPSAAVHECESNIVDFDLDEVFWVR